MAKMWQKVYDQNYHKSLDHRSFYFKQVRRHGRHSTQTCLPSAMIALHHGPLACTHEKGGCKLVGTSCEETCASLKRSL